jgi:hypothetical protein
MSVLPISCQFLPVLKVKLTSQMSDFDLGQLGTNRTRMSVCHFYFITIREKKKRSKNDTKQQIFLESRVQKWQTDIRLQDVPLTLQMSVSKDSGVYKVLDVLVQHKDVAIQAFTSSTS